MDGDGSDLLLAVQPLTNDTRVNTIIRSTAAAAGSALSHKLHELNFNMSRPSSMSFVFAAASALLVFTVCHSVGADESCSKLDILDQCFPEVTPRVRAWVESGAPINISMTTQFFTKGETDLTGLCRKFDTVMVCIDNEECSSPTDADNDVVLFWDRGSVAVAYMCRDKFSEFKGAQSCLANDEFRSAAASCDIARHHNRRKRHACGDYNQEVQCADKAIAERCGESTARVIGKMIRTFLSATPHTKDCPEPEYVFNKAVKSVNSVLSTLILSTITALAARCNILVQ